ncbi:MAG: UvrD-helicase domain-containing protein, partial [Desulfuromusa sp.]|nr:UvrD-helicase domain-containing protein [Desulfuromusa sp.]
TFTNKAAAEMRERLLKALEAARDDACPDTLHEKLTWQLAERALQRHGGQLLRNPAQLAIQTIDSFNAALVRKMPWLSRFGSLPEISDDADALYLQAAENLLGKLADGGSGDRLRLLLRHLDNNVEALQNMLVDMLRQRDQWLRHLVSLQGNFREKLQQGLENLCCEKLNRLQESVPSALADELLFCINYALTNREDSTAGEYFATLPGCDFDDLSRWLFVADLLLTGKGDVRKTVTKNNGFPAGKDNREAKERMKALLGEFDTESHFIRQLATVRTLPVCGYSDDQWLLLEALIELLPRLVGELWLVFRGRSQADYTEISLKAGHALGEAENPSDLLLQIDHDLQHILIDEFQDTSRLQYRLLDKLTSGWSDGDGRTLFLVGDPMQSIYRFREAEVGLFLQCFTGEFGDSQLPLQPLQLQCNFRSQQGIVDWVNTTFTAAFPKVSDAAQGAVPLTEAISVKALLPGDACRVHPFIGQNDCAEAEKVVELIQQTWAEDKTRSIAILVRGRTHLREILPLLRHHNINYLAKDIDSLSVRPTALDIVHLTRALLCRGDQLSWLAVLRAPWCGLTLADLTLLTADPAAGTLPTRLASTQLRSTLSEDAQQRLERAWPILQTGLSRRGRLPLRQLIEGCWLALGGATCCGDEGLTDASLVFTLLDKLDRGGDLESFELLDRGLTKLFAEPDSHSDGRLQIMTIHKAKGLEFDTVIIPGLGKKPRNSDSPLLRWLEHPDYGLLLGPVSARWSDEKDPIYQLIKQLEDEKDDLETARLLYVATTRAIRRLHLLGHAKENSEGEVSAQKKSLLEKLWPVVHYTFAAAQPLDETEEQPFIPPLLKRLPAGWELPQPISADVVIVPKSETASSIDTGTVFSGWENPLHRHVGTLVHLQLEQIVMHGSECWLTEDCDQRNLRLESSLSCYGVANSDLATGVEKVISAIDSTLASHRGRWILENHPEQQCELPITGVVDGKLIHAVIDRTFVADGCRWVIDYKTSSPAADETKENFLQREGAHYREQLEIYAQLLALQNDQLPVKAALYFPLINEWYEY